MTLTDFIETGRNYRRAIEEAEQYKRSLADQGVEALSHLLGKTVTVTTKKNTFVGTFKEFQGYPKSDSIYLHPCDPYSIRIHFDSIHGIKEV